MYIYNLNGVFRIVIPNLDIINECYIIALLSIASIARTSIINDVISGALISVSIKPVSTSIFAYMW